MGQKVGKPGDLRISVQFWPKQRQFWELIDRSENLWIAYGGAKGGGKANPCDCNVYTPSGPAKMGDLNTGDLVSCPDGSTAKVLAIWPHPKTDVYRVTFDDGASVEATLNHLWKVRGAGTRRYDGKNDHSRKPGDHQWSVIDTATLKKTIDSGKRVYIPLTKPVEFERSANLPLAPYVLGALLGDGSLQALVAKERVDLVKVAGGETEGRYRGTYAYDRVRMTSADPEIVARCAELGATPWSDLPKKNNLAREYGFDQVVAGSIRDLGLAGKKAWEKFVPKQYLIAPIADREELLRGLMDTDGSADKRGHAYFGTSSRQLAEDVQWLARSLGYKANLTSFTPTYFWKKEKRSGRLAFRVWIKGQNHENLFSLPRKKERATLPYGGRKENGANEAARGRRVMAVEFSRNTDCRCITIGHPDGLYVADDFVVTHNSVALRGILLSLLVKYRGMTALLLRKTYEEVYNNHVLKFWTEYPELEQYYAKNEKILHLPNGSKLFIGSGDKEGDVRRYNGMADFALIGVDQAEEFSEEDLGTLASCVRSTIRGFTPKVALTFNPGGQGHAHLKRVFLDREFLTHESPEDYAPLLRAFGWDNYEWVRPEAEAEKVDSKVYFGWPEEERKKFFLTTKYGRQLLGLAPDLQSKYLWGSFDLFEGQFFHKFDVNRVGYLPHEVQPESYWPRWISIDGGYDHPSAVYWHTTPDGKRVFTLNEFVQSRLEPSELGHAIAKLTLFDAMGKPLDPKPEITDVILSHDWFRADHTVKTRADILGDVLQSYGLPFPKNGGRDRKGRYRLMSQMMSSIGPDGFPDWRIDRVRCPKLIRTIPLCIRDPKDDDDVLKFVGDDPIDGAGQGIQQIYMEPYIPKDVRLQRRMEPFKDADPHTRAMMARIAAADDKKNDLAFVSLRRAYRNGGVS
jgi:hypothetical protein